MQVLSDGRIRRTTPEWKELIDRFDKSDLPIAAFCEKEGLSRSAFASWKRKLGALRKKAPSFVEVTSIAKRTPPVQSVSSTSTCFELALPGGVTLRWKG